MRHRSEVYLILALTVFALTGVSALRLLDAGRSAPIEPLVEPVMVVDPPPATTAAQEATAWFGSVRPFCNPVEVETRMRWQPAPETSEGQMRRAACYALAGRIELARGVIGAFPREQQIQAAGVVFEAGHPAADAGDELAAGPLMELVVEFWPNHHMALYHAGAAAFERSDYGPAWDYLERFLEAYSVHDGWRSNAERMLDLMTRIEG